mgnify:CR=1 FL=1
MSDVPPILLSSIICERAIFDRITGMPSLINIVHEVKSPEFPARNWQLVFFSELTNGHGQTDAVIRLVYVRDGERVVFEQKGSVKFEDVRQVVTLAVNLQGIVFPEPGEYRFQLYANNTQLGERKVECRKVKLPPGRGER